MTPAGEQGSAGHDGPAAILIGPPGAGKSTVGPLLAALLGTGFTDTDELVEQEAGKPVGDIFVEDGEQAFRALERAAVAGSLGNGPGVLGLGGGAVLDAETQRLLAGRGVVYLRTGFAAAAKRVGLGAPRPLLAINPRARLKELLDQRIPVYEGLAWLTVDTDDREPQQVAEEIAAALTTGSAAGASNSPAQRNDGGKPSR